jgi:hypothetical protein
MHLFSPKILLLLLAVFTQLPTPAKVTEEMPIIAFIGVPEGRSTDEHFRVFSECGFTVSLNTYTSLNLLVKACRYADKYGVKVLGKCPEMVSNPQLAAQTLQQEKGFFGYHIQDEPSVPEISQRQQEIERLYSIDSTHVFYINLHPYYRDSWVESTLKVKTYPEYLKAASATSCQQLSFDFYPVMTSGIRPTWYHNLEMIRQESLASGKPFWGFVLSIPHDVPFTPDTFYPTPTMGSLRLQVYSNLAYGAQAIQYFTYWNPGSGRFNYHDAPVDEYGKKTKTYDVVQQMNRELKTVAKLFYGAQVLSVHHLGAIPQGTTRQTEMPVNIRSLKIVGRQGAVISQFEKNGHRYLAILNKSHEQMLRVRIRTRNNVPQHLTKSLSAEHVKANYTVAEGDILLFKLK